MNFYSHGKLLITGEYFVLDGARALAVPTRAGQSMLVAQTAGAPNVLEWSSYTKDGQRWFHGYFNLPSGQLLESTDHDIGRRLEQIFRFARKLRPELWRGQSPASLTVSTHLEFPRNWGLGTSSTLIANLARWWDVDPYALLAGSFGGSGYDLACARASGPIFYQVQDGKAEVSSTSFYPEFADQLHFLFLEQKQNSREGIAHYRAQQPHKPSLIDRISSLTQQAAKTADLYTFREILEEHEMLIGESIGITPVRKRIFPDFQGTIKSLGAWGGDFVMVVSELQPEEIRRYFAQKGFRTLKSYQDMVFSSR